MDNRVAIVGIFVEDNRAAAPLNDILHEYSGYIVGRMGLPYRERGVSVISLIVDAPGDVIGAMAGKLGMLQDVTAKTIYSKIQ